MKKRFSTGHLLTMLLIVVIGAILAMVSYFHTHSLIWPIIIGLNGLVALLAVRDHALVLYHQDHQNHQSTES